MGHILALQRQMHAAVGPEKGDAAFQHRQVDMLAAAAALAGEERGGDRLRRRVGTFAGAWSRGWRGTGRGSYRSSVGTCPDGLDR